ncbi:hypothetical protein AX14_005646 [Amanita brunnescens Koide BX004]|nr:hypothetical protein AX14_005646 [Amanita brunnescens Koide BX004]
MYNQLSTLPLPTSAQFYSQSSLSIMFDVRDHARNVKRVVTRTVILPPQTISTACEEVSSDVILSLVSPSKSYRAILRDLSETGGPGRFVEIWNNDRLVACKNVTCAHGQFYSDEFISSISFSPSETSLLYIAEQNPPSSDDVFAKFRYAPSFWRRPTKLQTSRNVYALLDKR